MSRFVDDYLLYLLARASAAASADFHAELAAKGVAVPDWRIMAVLHGTDGATVGELAGRCPVKQPTLTRAVERLEKKQLVERIAGEDDRRLVRVTLTGKGASLVVGLIEMARQHETRLLSAYAPKEAATLKRVLKVLIERSDSGRHLGP